MTVSATSENLRGGACFGPALTPPQGVDTRTRLLLSLGGDV